MTLIPEHVNNKDADILIKHILTKRQKRSIEKVVNILSKEFQDGGELLLALEFISRELNLTKLSETLLDEQKINKKDTNIELIIQGNLSNSIVVVGSEQNQIYLDAIGTPTPFRPLPPS